MANILVVARHRRRVMAQLDGTSLGIPMGLDIVSAGVEILKSLSRIPDTSLLILPIWLQLDNTVKHAYGFTHMNNV